MAEEVICPICTDCVNVPVRLEILNCKCKSIQRYCLTCVRDSLNLNGHKNGAKNYSLDRCPTCRADFLIPADIFKHDDERKLNRVNWDQIYSVDIKLLAELDNKFGDIYCPRGCIWTGLRKDLRVHLTKCTNAFRFNCNGCHQMFNKAGLLEHISTSKHYRFYSQCPACRTHLIDGETFLEHQKECSHKDDMICKLCQSMIPKDREQMISHLLKCCFIDPFAPAKKNP